MKSVIKLLVFASITLFLVGCGSKYAYKPISGLSPKMTHEQSLKNCKSKVGLEFNQIKEKRLAEIKEEVEKEKTIRLANPTYRTSTNCHKTGRDYSCTSTSIPDINYGYSLPERSRLSGAKAGLAIGSILTRSGKIEKCMLSYGFKRVKINKDNKSNKPVSGQPTNETGNYKQLTNSRKKHLDELKGIKKDFIIGRQEELQRLKKLKTKKEEENKRTWYEGYSVF
jgi:ribosomal protein L20A (L18A)